MSRNRAILLVAIATALSAVVLLFAGSGFAGSGFAWLRVIVGLPFALLLPGHAVMLIVDPDVKLGRFEWFTLSVGVSISAAILVGMGLAASVGLTADRTIVVLTAMTFVMLMAAGARVAASPPRRRLASAWRNSFQRASFGALALLACALLVLVLSIPRVGTSSSGNVVQLWGLPDTSGGLRIGAKNINASSAHYRLTIEQGGRLITQREIELSDGTNHIFVVKKSATWTTSAPVVAVLTDVNSVVPPRTISVWTTTAAVPVWRFRSKTVVGNHLWTLDPTEKASIIAGLPTTWIYEGPAFDINPENPLNDKTLWRFRNKKDWTYFYTADPAEKASLVNNLGTTWALEGPAWDVCPTPTPMPVWRFRCLKNSTHLWTSDPDEKLTIETTLQSTYALEGIAYWLAQ